MNGLFFLFATVAANRVHRKTAKHYNGNNCSFDIPQNLLQQLYKIRYEEKPLVSIRDDLLKITLFHEGKKNIIDYKSTCPNGIFITEYIPDAKNHIMKMSDLKMNRLSGYFRD